MLAELGINLVDISAVGVLALAVLMIFTGRLVPKRYYEEALLRIEHEREAKDNWRQAAESLLAQNGMLIQRDDISMATLNAIRARVEGTEKEEM